MQIKAGVKLNNLKPQTVVAMVVTESIFQQVGFPFVITSGSEGKHMPGSKHVEGLAFDFRTRELPEAAKDDVFGYLKGDLGKDFDVIREGDHGHVEYDPKA